MTAKCHTDFKKLKTLHEPASDDCTTCHEKTGDHAFAAIENQAELCVTCHDEVKKGKKLHPALEDGECTSCHNPHGGSYYKFLNTERVDGVCFECHDQDPMKKKVVHGPIDAGNCTDCHKPHASDFEKLLKVKKEKLCIQCHDDKDFAGKKMKVHSILEDGCDNCHNPHASDFPFQLSAAPTELCGKCHDDIIEAAQKKTTKHPPLQTQRKCLNCHNPHASKYENNLLDEQLTLCLGCHNKPIKSSSGKEYNMYDIITKNPDKHGPIEDNNCTECHDPHGSNFIKILKAAFPPKLYTSFEEDKYAICFTCHDSTLVTEETTTDTDFRDGQRNLHFVHVNKKKGRTCRICHELHAGKLPKQIRENVPFGKWAIPIGFKETPSGGGCSPGCHKTVTYDRNKKGS
jgi:predicted CXXCH cytochrome family protein